MVHRKSLSYTLTILYSLTDTNHVWCTYEDYKDDLYST